MSTRKELKDFVMAATFSGSNTIILTDVYKNVEIDQLKNYIVEDVALDVAAATASIANLEGDLSVVEGNLSSATASITTLNNDLASATASIATLNNDLIVVQNALDLRIEKFMVDNTATGDATVQIDDRCGTATFTQYINVGSNQWFVINNTTLREGDIILLSMEYNYTVSGDEPVILYHTVIDEKLSILVKNIGTLKVSNPIKIHFIKIN